MTATLANLGSGCLPESTRFATGREIQVAKWSSKKSLEKSTGIPLEDQRIV